MPAFGFRPQFVEPIRAQSKRHTIRAAIPRGYVVGHWAPLYTGLRTKAAQLIGSGKMGEPGEVRIDFDAGEVSTVHSTIVQAAADAFARRDGFEDFAAMEAFWAVHHPGVRQFTGWLLPWTVFTTDHRLGKPPP